MIELILTNKGDPDVKRWMSNHYSQPKGFVGRQLIYRIRFCGRDYGAIAGGSATKHLPGRDEFFGQQPPLGSIINNTFFHIERPDDGYPIRNFAPRVVKAWRATVTIDWKDKYGDEVAGFETLVEPPRTGELYLRDGWTLGGKTIGYTCKREAGGQNTFEDLPSGRYYGKRVWDRENLRPKLVFYKKTNQ